MKAINKKITLLVAIALAGSSLMCMMENNVAENNTVLFELSKRLRAEYNEVAHTTYKHVTVEGLDGKPVNLNTIIHDLQKVEKEQPYVCDQGIFNDTLCHALRLALDRGMAELRDQDMSLSNYDFVLKDLKYKLDLFKKLGSAQTELDDIVASLKVLDAKRHDVAIIAGISRMGMR